MATAAENGVLTSVRAIGRGDKKLLSQTDFGIWFVFYFICRWF